MGVLASITGPLAVAQVALSQDQQQPTFKRAKIVIYVTDKKPGSIIIDTAENKLYYVLGLNRAAMYRVDL